MIAPDGTSFDNKKDYKKYMMSLIKVRKLAGEEIMRGPSTVSKAGEHGNPFYAEDLSNCVVIVADHVAEAFIDACVDCQIFIGPTAASVFIRA